MVMKLIVFLNLGINLLTLPIFVNNNFSFLKSNDSDRLLIDSDKLLIDYFKEISRQEFTNLYFDFINKITL